MSTGFSSRLSYDDSSYISSVDQSVTPLSYMLNGNNYKNCDKCIPEPSLAVPNNFNELSEPQIDIENTLTNRNWKNDKKQLNSSYVDMFPQEVDKYSDFFKLNDCTSAMISKNSLLTDPKSKYKSLSTQHLVFTPLPIAADNVYPIIGNPGFISSRDVAIDLYRKNMNITTPR